MFRFSFLLLMILFIISPLVTCDNDSGSRKSSTALPTSFPLKENTMWVYERHYYYAGNDTMTLDTLYILEKMGDYYQYSWEPDEYCNLIKNEDNKLLSCGEILFFADDTSYYEKPYIWTFYGEKEGYIDISTLTDNYDVNCDSIHVSIERKMPFLNSKYDTYIIKRVYDYDDDYNLQFTNKLGFAQWQYIDKSSGELLEETIMIKPVSNYNPSAMNKATLAKDKYEVDKKRHIHPDMH